MLVHADGVEAHLIGVLEHVEVLVVEPMPAHRVVEPVRHVDPDAVVALAEVLRQPPIRHEMEPAELHLVLLAGLRRPACGYTGPPAKASRREDYASAGAVGRVA